MAADTSPTGTVAGRSRPKEYVRHRPLNWWTKNPRYTLFIFRELSSGFLAIYALFLFCMMQQVDRKGWDGILESLKSPVSMLLHAVVLGFALLNTYTTFKLAPRVLKIRQGEELVPESAITGAHWAAFVVASIVLVVLALRFG